MIQTAPDPAARLREAGLRVTGPRLVCRGCGRTEDVGGAQAAPHGESAGYVIDGADVTFWGLCPACA